MFIQLNELSILSEEPSIPTVIQIFQGEDPWIVAQSFIHKNELPQTYLDQVANFIVTNAGSTPVIETSSSGSYYDPFTGDGRYIPGSGSNFNSGTGNVDPFTSGSSYSSQRTGQKIQSSSTSSASSAKHFPYGQYTTIVTCDSVKVLSKLRLEPFAYSRSKLYYMLYVIWLCSIIILVNLIIR